MTNELLVIIGFTALFIFNLTQLFRIDATLDKIKYILNEVINYQYGKTKGSVFDDPTVLLHTRERDIPTFDEVL